MMLLIPVVLVVLVIGLMVLLFIWPLVLCWHLGHPVVGVFAEIAWLVMLNGRG
jgi:hypothetical protein